MNTEHIVTEDFKRWREQARTYLREGIPPENTHWGQGFHLFQETPKSLKSVAFPKVPAEFFKLARLMACARFDGRWTLLYRLLFRLNHENPYLLKISIDPDVQHANQLAKSVERDIHKMHAFVRFKKVEKDNLETYVAWHQPEHLIIELATPFFVRRFGDKPWSIFTPDASAHWDLQELKFSEGLSQNEFHHRDDFDDLWKIYYRSIYNPARLKIKMMKSEMAPKYWSSLPETDIIHELIRDTPKRLQNISQSEHSQAQIPENASWSELRQSAQYCKACPLALHTQNTVFGEGDLSSKLMIVGDFPEKPEDLQSKVFTGPTEEILNEALKAAGLCREKVYITNAVKHFKQDTDQKSQNHFKAGGSEIHACKPWLEAEIALIQPKVILALGITAGISLYGRLVRIQDELTKPHHTSSYASTLLISWHPAVIFNAPSTEEKQKRFQDLVNSLRLADQMGDKNLSPHKSVNSGIFQL